MDYGSSAVLDRARDEPPLGSGRPPRRGKKRRGGRAPKDPLWARLLINQGPGALSSYELISPESTRLFTAVRDDQVEGFISTHSDWVARS